MKEYSEFPPFKYFMRVLKSCPRSALLYLQLWKRRGKRDYFTLEKKDIRKEYLISPTLFRNLIAPLMYLNLIHFIEGESKYNIDISGPQVDD